MPSDRRPARAAVALGYEPGRDRAPKVLAAGRGWLAERIVEAAEAAGVPIHEDAPLAELLAQVAPGEEIPPEAWEAVAEILAFLMRVDARLAEEASRAPADPAARPSDERPSPPPSGTGTPSA